MKKLLAVVATLAAALGSMAVGRKEVSLLHGQVSIQCQAVSSNFGTHGIEWTIKNTTDKTQDYVVDVVLYDAERNQLGVVTILENRVPPGDTIQGTDFLSEQTAPPVRCRVALAAAWEVR